MVLYITILVPLENILGDSNFFSEYDALDAALTLASIS